MIVKLWGGADWGKRKNVKGEALSQSDNASKAPASHFGNAHATQKTRVMHFCTASYALLIDFFPFFIEDK